ncbi:MAG: hypothetical protein OEZ13_12025 [Spirochaetia bacterium]|nr:hypothetical protein [Spirochaetia bacterium]
MKTLKLFFTKARNPDKIFLLRVFAVIVALDFVSFFSLSSINPFQLLNPFKFLEKPHQDEREELTLYFPKVKHELFNLSENARNKKVIQREIEDEIISLNQKVYQVNIPDEYQKGIKKNAEHIIHELILGPKDKKIQAARLIKEKKLIKDIWVKNINLIINLDHLIWKEIDPIKQKMIKICVEKSILKNLSGIQNITWYFDNYKPSTPAKPKAHKRRK